MEIKNDFELLEYLQTLDSTYTRQRLERIPPTQRQKLAERINLNNNKQIADTERNIQNNIFNNLDMPIIALGAATIAGTFGKLLGQK